MVCSFVCFSLHPENNGVVLSSCIFLNFSNILISMKSTSPSRNNRDISSSSSSNCVSSIIPGISLSCSTNVSLSSSTCISLSSASSSWTIGCSSSIVSSSPCLIQHV